MFTLRKIVLVGLLAVASFSLARLSLQTEGQDLDKKVTYSTVAVPTGRAVQEIAKLTGVKLDVSPSQNRDILVIHVTDVPLRKLMDQIATATTGEWRQDGDVWRLIRDGAKQSAEERKELQEQTAKVREVIKKLVESHKQKPEIAKGEGEEAEIMAEAMAGMGMFGGSKAVVDLLARVDPALIAGMEKDARLVFGTNPTRMQRPLTIDPAMVTKMVEEHNKAAQAWKEAEANRVVTAEEEQMMKWAERFTPWLRRRDPITTPPAKALFVITRDGSFMGGTSASLRLFDAKGQVILESTQQIPLGEGFDWMTLAEIEMDDPEGVKKEVKQEPADDSPPIKLSPVAEEMATMFSRFYGPGADEPQVSKELAERLARPDQYDPLSFDVSESLLAVAEHKKLNLVANVPDTKTGGFMSMMISGDKPQTVNGFLKKLQDEKDTTVAMEDGWLVVRPSKPAQSRKERVDRVALARFIAACVGKEVPSLDDLAAYAAVAEPPMVTPLVSPYIANYAASVFQGGFMGMLSWDMLRFYGTMSASQRQVLASGGRLNFGSLSPVQRALVDKMTFGASARLKVDREGAPTEDDDPWFMFAFMQMGSGGTDFRDEPTEVMPNGLPSSGFLEMKALEDHFVVVVGDKGGNVRQYGSLGADELAMLKFFMQDENMQQVAAQMPKFDKFRLGSRTSMEFKFHLAPGIRVEHTLRDDRLGKDAPVVGEGGFPAAFKAQIDKRIQAFKKFPFPMGMGQEVPPPPE